jgi:hypothetical protein
MPGHSPVHFRDLHMVAEKNKGYQTAVHKITHITEPATNKKMF